MSTSTGTGFDWYGYGYNQRYLGVTHTNIADKVKQGDKCPMIKDVDWTIGTKVNGKKPK
jgi:hypothetical protein